MADAGDGRNSIYTEPQAGGLIDFQYLGMVFLIILVIGSLFEIGLLIFAYVNADKVECNLLWCTFTTERSYGSESSFNETTFTSSSTSTRTCYEKINGIKQEINCSIIDKEFGND